MADSQREPRSRRRWVRGVVIVVIVVFGLIPLYAVAGASILRTHLLSGGKVTPDDARAAWIFLAAWTAGVASVLSAAMAWSHNSRSLAQEREIQERTASFNREIAERTASFDREVEERTASFNREVEQRIKVQEHENQSRLRLDTAVKGLALLSTSNGGYAARSAVAGALATLVHLDHPIVAMRALGPAWVDDAVDSPTAAWLISEVFRKATPERGDSLVEASQLLYARAGDMVGEKPVRFWWPSYLDEHFDGAWPSDAQFHVLMAACKMLCCRPLPWWQGQHHWPTPIFDAAISYGYQDWTFVSFARRAQAILLRDVSPERDGFGHTFGSKLQSYGEMKERLGDVVEADLGPLSELLESSLDELDSWASTR